jgi:transcriptional regulator with XRE-family HTH domain
MADEGQHGWEPSPLGDFVRAWRQRARLSQKDLAARLNISDTYLSQIERGRIPDFTAPDFFPTWTRVFDISKEDLIASGELWRYNPVPVPELTPRLMLLHYRTQHLTDAELDRLLDALDRLHPEHRQGHE